MANRLLYIENIFQIPTHSYLAEILLFIISSWCWCRHRDHARSVRISSSHHHHLSLAVAGDPVCYYSQYYAAAAAGSRWTFSWLNKVLERPQSGAVCPPENISNNKNKKFYTTTRNTQPSSTIHKLFFVVIFLEALFVTAVRKRSCDAC